MLSDFAYRMNKGMPWDTVSTGISAFSTILLISSSAGLIHALGWIWGVVAVISLNTVFPLLFLGIRTAIVNSVTKNMTIEGNMPIIAKTFAAAFGCMLWIQVFACVGQFIWGDRLNAE
jgi:hypothetical protein